MHFLPPNQQRQALKAHNYEQVRDAQIQTARRIRTDKMTHRMLDKCWPPVPSGIYPASHKLDRRRTPYDASKHISTHNFQNIEQSWQ